MANDFFYFKKFSIRQQDSAMKVGTDGVLLGSWVSLGPDDKKILDIGTGTGLIAIMLAQRTSISNITAIEIEPKAAEEANFNINRCPWNNRINIVCESLQNYANTYSCDTDYNLIVSNPPYFNGSYKSDIVERTAARHSELLNSDDLIDGVVKLLDKDSGRFVAIFPYETGTIFIAKAASKGLYCNKICNVYPKQHSSIKRIIAEFSYKRIPTINTNLVIAIENRIYTQQYKELTKDFYLKF